MAYSYIDQSQKKGKNIESLYALEYLRHKVVAKLGLNLLQSLKLDVSYRYQYRIGGYTNAAGALSGYKPYSLVDARLSWEKPAYSVYVEANNLLDEDYIDYGNVPQPGIWITAGAKWHFSL